MWGPEGCKDHTKGQEDKRVKAEGRGRRGHFEIKDGRIIFTKGSLTCVVAPLRLLTHLCAVCFRWEEEKSKREQLESTVESMEQVTSAEHLRARQIP